MNAAERILLSLEAQECLVAFERFGQRVEPVVVDRGVCDFGTVLGQQTVAELQDIMASWSYRMQQLAGSYTSFASTWQARDSAAFTDWTADYTRLQNRYNAAMSKAQAAVSSAKLNFATPNSLIPAQAEYDGLAKAMRQCYPPDGCPIAKGDFDDLDSRLRSAGVRPDYSAMPQPQARDVDISVYSATAPVDVIAQVRGLEAPKLPGLGPTAKFWAWLVKHQKGVLIGSVAVAGGIIALQVLPLLMLPLKAAKGLAAVAA
jgi:hypothetical protein